VFRAAPIPTGFESLGHALAALGRPQTSQVSGSSMFSKTVRSPIKLKLLRKMNPISRLRTGVAGADCAGEALPVGHAEGSGAGTISGTIALNPLDVASTYMRSDSLNAVAEGEGFGPQPSSKSFEICESPRQIDSLDPHDPHKSRGLHT
jgi:hypothetical protein